MIKYKYFNLVVQRKILGILHIINYRINDFSYILSSREISNTNNQK